MDCALLPSGVECSLTCYRNCIGPTGSQSPTWDQLDALGFAALQTAIARTPWARRFRPIAPSERRDFGPLFDGWATTLENRLRAKLAEPDEEAARDEQSSLFHKSRRPRVRCHRIDWPEPWDDAETRARKTAAAIKALTMICIVSLEICI
jgi:hypothetical protein